MAKTKFNKRMIQEAFEYACQGLTREQIAHNLGISKDTFYKYWKRYPDFADAIKKGEQLAISKVENALFKLAIGYDYEEVRQTITVDKNGKEYKKVEKFKKHVPPNPTAIIFFLKNRASDRWSDGKDIAIEGMKVLVELVDNEREEDKGQ